MNYGLFRYIFCVNLVSVIQQVVSNVRDLGFYGYQK
jgi:hypothetical protein